MENTPPGLNDPMFITMAAAAASPAFPKVTHNKQAGFITFGDRNDFPQHVISINSKSPVNSAIIESTVTYICGKGVRDSEANVEGFIGRPNSGESWDDLIENVATDYVTFGGFYLQVILNTDTTTVSIFHQDYASVRIGQITGTGAPITFKISNDWKKVTGKDKPIELPVWAGMQNAKPGVAYLYNFWNYSPGLRFYCVPRYFSAIDYIKADGALGEFYNNSIENGFTPSAIISMPSNPTPEKKKETHDNFKAAFQGKKGASAVIMLWGESDGVKPTVTPFASAANADIYNEVEQIIFQKIISTHRLSSPTLAGVSGSGNLSGNASEIIDSYVLYNYTVIEKQRRKILDALNLFTKINNLAPLQIDESDVLKRIAEVNNPTANETKFARLIKKISWK